MYTLCGFATSNYHNKVKLALEMKKIPYTEELVWPGKGAVEAGSPIGKLPFLKTPTGVVSESDVILEFLEAAHPEHPLIPKDPYQAAKVRELNTFLNLHVELGVRPVFSEAFFGGKVSDEVKNTIEKPLRRAVKAMLSMTKFTPYICGETFTIADCSAIFHFPMVSRATKVIYGEDFLEGAPAAQYLERMATELAPMKQILADRKQNSIEMTEWIAAARQQAQAAKQAQQAQQ
jgi:glutathione S-transferase